MTRTRAWFLTFAAVGMALAVGAASGQSLAEVAKKEKERRAANQGKNVRTVTDRELGTRLPPSTFAEEPSPGSGDAGTPAAGTTDPAGADAAKAAPDPAKTREHWQKRVQQAQQKVSDLEAKLASAELNWGGGLRTDVNPVGQRNLSQRADVEQQLNQARAELEAVREEARRAGIPAGWVR